MSSPTLDLYLYMEQRVCHQQMIHVPIKTLSYEVMAVEQLHSPLFNQWLRDSFLHTQIKPLTPFSFWPHSLYSPVCPPRVDARQPTVGGSSPQSPDQHGGTGLYKTTKIITKIVFRLYKKMSY